jgi:hypothetical protein
MIELQEEAVRVHVLKGPFKGSVTQHRYEELRLPADMISRNNPGALDKGLCAVLAGILVLAGAFIIGSKMSRGAGLEPIYIMTAIAGALIIVLGVVACLRVPRETVWLYRQWGGAVAF